MQYPVYNWCIDSFWWPGDHFDTVKGGWSGHRPDLLCTEYDTLATSTPFYQIRPTIFSTGHKCLKQLNQVYNQQIILKLL